VSMRLAAWVIDQEIKAAKWAGITVAEENELELLIWLGLIQSPFIVAGSMTPYWQLGKLHAGTKWAVRDTLWTRAVKRTGAFGGRFNTYTLFNYYPKIGAFAQRGGWRFVATRAGSRFIPYLGWALFAIDAWSVGKWIGEKTKGKPLVGAPWG